MNHEDSWSKAVTQRLGQAVRTARIIKGLSAEDLSKETEKVGHKIPRNTIANLENGRKESFPVHELMILSEVLDIPIVHFMAFPNEHGQVAVTPNRKRSAGEALFRFSDIRSTFDSDEWDDTPYAIEATQAHYAISHNTWKSQQPLIENLKAGFQPGGGLGEVDLERLDRETRIARAAIEAAASTLRRFPDRIKLGDYPDFDKLVLKHLDEHPDDA